MPFAIEFGQLLGDPIRRCVDDAGIDHVHAPGR